MKPTITPLPMAAVVWNGSILWDQPQNAGASASSANAQVAVCRGLIARHRRRQRRHAAPSGAMPDRQTRTNEPDICEHRFLFAGCPANKLTGVIVPILVDFIWQGRC